MIYSYRINCRVEYHEFKCYQIHCDCYIIFAIIATKMLQSYMKKYFYLSLTFFQFIFWINFSYTDSVYTFIIRYMMHNLNLNLKFKFYICVMYSTVIIYILLIYIILTLIYILYFICMACIIQYTVRIYKSYPLFLPIIFVKPSDNKGLRKIWQRNGLAVWAGLRKWTTEDRWAMDSWFWNRWWMLTSQYSM